MKVKMLVWLVVIMVIINIAALGTIIFHRTNPDSGIGRLFHSQGLSPDTEHKFSPGMHHWLRDSRQRVDSLISPLRNEIKKYQEEMFIEIAKETPDTLVINRLIDQIGNLQTEIQRNVVNNLLNNTELSPEERAKFLKMIERRTFKHRREDKPFGSNGRFGKRRFGN